jgi:TolB-like protein
MNMKHFSVKVFSVCLFLAAIALLHCSFSFAYEEEIKDISSTMAQDIANAGKKTIAVADFTDLQGNVTELGRFLAEEFSVALAGAGTRFEVVDRIHLKSIIREHKLSATGMIDPKTARKLGKIAGVQALITGTVTPFGDNVRVTVKILDTETAKIIGASTANIAKTKAIEELLARGIETRSPYQQPTSSQYIPPAGTNMSKKVGPLIITMKKITVLSKGRVDVTIAFSNSSDKQFRLAASIKPRPRLNDDRGNVYEYDSGVALYGSSRSSRWKRALTLYPKSQSNVTLRFRAEDRDIKFADIGNIFSFSMRPIVLYSKDKSEGLNVFFDGVKPYKPK